MRVREARKFGRALPELVSGKYGGGRYGRAAALQRHFFPTRDTCLCMGFFHGMLLLKMEMSSRAILSRRKPGGETSSSVACCCHRWPSPQDDLGEGSGGGESSAIRLSTQVMCRCLEVIHLSTELLLNKFILNLYVLTCAHLNFSFVNGKITKLSCSGVNCFEICFHYQNY